MIQERARANNTSLPQTSPLHRHIREAQDKACMLDGLLEAFCNLDVAHHNSRAAIIAVASEIAHELNHHLDVVNLPDGEAA